MRRNTTGPETEATVAPTGANAAWKATASARAPSATATRQSPSSSPTLVYCLAPTCCNFKKNVNKILLFILLGYITKSEDLPVTRLSFGHTGATYATGIFTLGPLECSSRQSVPDRPTSCRDLWLLGHSLSGFYDVQEGPLVASVYCDFRKMPADTGIIIHSRL